MHQRLISVFDSHIRCHSRVCCIRCSFQVDSLMETPFSAHPVIFLLTFVTQLTRKHIPDKGSNTQKGATLCTQQYVVTRA